MNHTFPRACSRMKKRELVDNKPGGIWGVGGWGGGVSVKKKKIDEMKKRWGEKARE